jgi:hypothetical protein
VPTSGNYITGGKRREDSGATDWDPAWGGGVECAPLAAPPLQLLVEPLDAPAPLALEVAAGQQQAPRSRALREKAHQHLDALSRKKDGLFNEDTAL